MAGIKPWEDHDYMFKLVMRKRRSCKTMIEKILRLKCASFKLDFPI